MSEKGFEESLVSGKIPIGLGAPSAVRIPIFGSDGLAIEFWPRGHAGARTSRLFFQDITGKRSLRLDYGYNKRTQTIDYHWNQSGTHSRFGISDHTPTNKSGTHLYKASRWYRHLGGLFLVYGAASDLHSIVAADRKMERASEVVAAWALAWAGCKSVGGTGAISGTSGGPVGIAVGGFVGCIIGGMGGYTGGEIIGNVVFQWAEGTSFTSIETQSNLDLPIDQCSLPTTKEYKPNIDSVCRGSNYVDLSCRNAPTRFEYEAYAFPDPYLTDYPDDIPIELENYLIESALNSPRSIFPNDDKDIHVGEKLGTSSLFKRPRKQVLERVSPSVAFSRDQMLRMRDASIEGEGSGRLNSLLKQLGRIRFSLSESRPIQSRKWHKAKTIVREIAQIRQSKPDDLVNQYIEFLRLRDQAEKRNGTTEMELDGGSKGYLGSTPSLRFGKVVGDVLGLDPVFGALLNPSGGIVGRGFKRVYPPSLPFVKVDYSSDKLRQDPLVMHAIYHDAGGYLKVYHDLGPGYDYLRREQNCDSRNGLVGQRTGIAWWANQPSASRNQSHTTSAYPFGIHRLNFDMMASGLTLYLEQIGVCQTPTSTGPNDEFFDFDGSMNSDPNSYSQEQRMELDRNRLHGRSGISNSDPYADTESESGNKNIDQSPYRSFTFYDFQDWLTAGYHRDYPTLSEHLQKSYLRHPLSEPVFIAQHNHLNARRASYAGDIKCGQTIHARGLPSATSATAWDDVKGTTRQLLSTLNQATFSLAQAGSSGVMTSKFGADWQHTKMPGNPIQRLLEALELAKSVYLATYILRYGSEKIVDTLFQFIDGLSALGEMFVLRFNKGMEEWGIFGLIGGVKEIGAFLLADLLPSMVTGIIEQVGTYFSQLCDICSLLADGCSMALAASVGLDIDSAARKIAEGLARLFVIAIEILIFVMGVVSMAALIAKLPGMTIRIASKAGQMAGKAAKLAGNTGQIVSKAGLMASRSASRSFNGLYKKKRISVTPVKAMTSWQQAQKFWTRNTIFKTIKVFQRNDLINPKRIDDVGRTNVQRMKEGLAPIGPDGKSINLHHLTQGPNGAVAELSQTFHQKNSRIIHINPNTFPSGIDRNAFNTWKRAYWESRANDFLD